MNAPADADIATAGTASCDWPVTNCYIDVWMLILGYWGLEAAAGLGVTVTQDYEGDQFTFFKYRHEDLEHLYGIQVGELVIYTSVEQQVLQQVRLGRLALVEVDSFYLPDTRATSYRRHHTKTTIGVGCIDPDAAWLRYFHNDGHYELTGEDYAGLFRKLPSQQGDAAALPPYVEFVRRRWPPLQGSDLTDAAVALLRRHLRRRPESNPVSAYRADFSRHMDWLIGNPHLFHNYAFTIFRQLGANFQLLGQHLRWLQGRGKDGLNPVIDAAETMSGAAKVMQFKVARIASRRRIDPCTGLFDTLEDAWDTAMQGLDRRFG